MWPRRLLAAVALGAASLPAGPSPAAAYEVLPDGLVRAYSNVSLWDATGGYRFSGARSYRPDTAADSNPCNQRPWTPEWPGQRGFLLQNQWLGRFNGDPWQDDWIEWGHVDYCTEVGVESNAPGTAMAAQTYRDFRYRWYAGPSDFTTYH